MSKQKKAKQGNEVKAVQVSIKEVLDDHKDILIELYEEKTLLWDPTEEKATIVNKQAAWLDIDASFRDIYPDLLFGGMFLS